MTASYSFQQRRAWLVLVTTLVVLALGVLLAKQVHDLLAVQRMRSEPTAPYVSAVFQLERTWSRFNQVVGDAATHTQLPDRRSVDTALQDFQQQVAALDATAPAQVLNDSPQFVQLRARLQTLLEAARDLLAQPAVTSSDYGRLSEMLHAAMPDMNAWVESATGQLTREQDELLRQQEADAQWGAGSLGVLIVFCVVSAVVLWRRQALLEQERQHMAELHVQLEASNAKAQAASRSKGHFLANMSHELRTPFNGMLGMLSLLENTPLNAQQTDYIQTATRSAKHLLTLLNDILDASAMEAGKLTLKANPVSLRAMFADVQALMKPQALEKRLGFEVQISRHMPAWLLADDTRVKQIALNLVSNALKFSTQGVVRLHVRTEPEAPMQVGTEVAVYMEVSDEGVGLSPEAVARLFQRFEQGDVDNVRKFGGTGLGLEISRTLARHMGGDITVSSTLGVGSTFTAVIRLPVVEAPAQERLDTAVVRRAPGVPGLDILVAEDNAINRKYMGLLLGNMGHSVRFAEHGGHVVNAVREKTPDIILMDLHMPEVDGLQATEAVRGLPTPLALVPIIALTADVFEESRDRVSVAGMDGFLSKPVNIHALERLLVQRFGERGASVANVPPAPVVATKSAPEAVAEKSAEAAPVAAPPRRRFRAGEVAEHLNMVMVGDLCVGVTLKGYQSLLEGVLGSESQGYKDLLAALDEGRTADLLELGHSFKGVSASLGLTALAKIALTVEKQGYSFTAEDCAQWSQSLQEAWKTTFAICARMGLVTTA